LLLLGCPPPHAALPYVDGVALAIISEATLQHVGCQGLRSRAVTIVVDQLIFGKNASVLKAAS